MKENPTPNYGLDAPVAVRNMLIAAALGLISLITRLMGVWSPQDVVAMIARPLMVAGVSCGAMAGCRVRAGTVSHRRGQTALDRPRRRHRQMAAGRSQRQQRSGHPTQRHDRRRRR